MEPAAPTKDSSKVGSSAARQWNEAHRTTNSSASADSNVNANATPYRLYTDKIPPPPSRAPALRTSA